MNYRTLCHAMPCHTIPKPYTGSEERKYGQLHPTLAYTSRPDSLGQILQVAARGGRGVRSRQRGLWIGRVRECNSDASVPRIPWGCYAVRSCVVAIRNGDIGLGPGSFLPLIEPAWHNQWLRTASFAVDDVWYYPTYVYELVVLAAVALFWW
jgi:hypothetical protein